MADLFLGDSAALGSDRGLAALAREFAQGGLPEARGALGARILAELKGVKRLCEAPLAAELKLARRLATKMVMGQGKTLPIEAITEAFAVRSKRFVAQEAVSGFLAAFPAPDDKLAELIALEENVVGQENKRSLAGYVLPILKAHGTETHFLDGAESVTRRLARLAELQTACREAGFPDLQKRQMLEAFDRLACRLADKVQLFETILRREGPAAGKVLALVKLLNGAVLTEGELAQRARGHIQRLMKEPGFAEGAAAVALARGQGLVAFLTDLKLRLAAAGIDGAGQAAA